MNNVSLGLSTNKVEHDYEALQPELGWVPIDVVRKTLEFTTQLATYRDVGTLREHKKARCPMLNWRRLMEKYAADTWYASAKDVSCATCCQIFTGMSSHYTYIVGMQSESEGPTALKTFVRQIGAPFAIRNDNSTMQTGKAFPALLKFYCIGSKTTDPHHLQQNPAEIGLELLK